MILAPNPLYKGVATVEKWGASEKQITRSKSYKQKASKCRHKSKKVKQV